MGGETGIGRKDWKRLGKVGSEAGEVASAWRRSILEGMTGGGERKWRQWIRARRGMLDILFQISFF